MRTEQIAIFGSAFNPPTLGHASVLARLTHFDRVLLVPSFAHAWQKKMADFELRCEWLRLFVDELPQTNLEMSTIEASLENGKAITTWKLLHALQNEYPDAALTFVLGPDNFFNFAQFYRADDILKQWTVLACPQTINIRSTTIRERIALQQDISNLTTPRLAKLLLENQNKI